MIEAQFRIGATAVPLITQLASKDSAFPSQGSFAVTLIST